MIGKSKIPVCNVGKCWSIPYCSQCKAWMDQYTYQKWLYTVFLHEVQKHTGSPDLLLLDNAPGHFNGLQKDSI
jgi:DDE superfamily endonuclease